MLGRNQPGIAQCFARGLYQKLLWTPNLLALFSAVAFAFTGTTILAVSGEDLQ